MRRDVEGRQHRSTGTRIRGRSGGRRRRAPRRRRGRGGRLEVSFASLAGDIRRKSFAKRKPDAVRLMGAGGNMYRGLRCRVVLIGAMALLVCTAGAFAASKKGEDQNVRSVQGTVTDASENAIDGAVVQLKNTKNLQIRSFIAKEHGAYYFHGLSPDVDYELKADYQGQTSPTKTLSAFDSRKQAVINLKLNKK